MKRQALEQVIDKRVHELKKHSQKTPGAFETDDIHDLRLEYKKLRAFIRLLQLEPDAGHLSLPKDVKALYHAAGNVRDLQLFIATFPVDAPCFIEYRQKQLFHYKEALVVAVEQVHFKQALHSIQKALPSHLHPATIQKFLDQKIATIHIILQVAEEESDLHEIRKQVKDMIYCRKELGLDGEEPLADIATQLGDFNDRCHALSILQLANSELLPQNESSLLHQLQQSWIQQKTEQQQQLMQLLQNFQF